MKKSFLIICLVGFLLYFPSLFGKFVWDDEDFVYANKFIQNFQVDKFFTATITEGRGKGSNYFRPIQEFAYASTHSLFDLPAGRQGFNPFWYHLLNITVHILAACAIFYFFSLLYLKNMGDTEEDSLSASPQPAPGYRPLRRSTSRIAEVSGPMWITLLFLIHPIQTEAVSYISGLSDPLFVLFGFLSLIFFLKYDRSKLLVYWFIGLLLFILCLLSKETGLVFLGLLTISQFLVSYPIPKIRAFLSTLLPFYLTASLYLWYHFNFLNNFDIKSAWGNNPYANSVIVRLLTFIQNLFLYFQLLLFPKDLFMERDFSLPIQTHFLNPSLIILITLISLFIIFLWKLRRIHPHWNLLIFCFLGFFISFVPYTGLILINGIFYEHFLYLPLVFFFAFWLILFEGQISRIIKNPIGQICLIGLILIFGARNLSRQFDWIDPIRFYSQTLSHAPKSIRIINGLGMAYADQGDFESSIRTYSQGIRINSRVPNLYHNLANAYLAKGDVNSAEKNFLKAIEVDPKFYFSYQSLANLYSQTGQTEKLQNLIKRYQNPQSPQFP